MNFALLTKPNMISIVHNVSEIEWSSWSDCYIVSRNKKQYKSLFPRKPHEKFSECGIQKFSGRQYRTSRCLDNGFMEECIAAGKEHKRQTKKCTPSCKQSFINSRPPRYLYDNTSFGNKKILATKKKSGQQQDQSSNSEDYELVTGGEVEEVKRRSKKIVSEKHNKKQNDGFQHHKQALVSDGKKAFTSKKSNYVIPTNNLLPPHIKSTGSISADPYNATMSSIINKIQGKYT